MGRGKELINKTNNKLKLGRERLGADVGKNGAGKGAARQQLRVPSENLTRDLTWERYTEYIIKYDVWSISSSQVHMLLLAMLLSHLVPVLHSYQIAPDASKEKFVTFLCRISHDFAFTGPA